MEIPEKIHIFCQVYFYSGISMLLSDNMAGKTNLNCNHFLKIILEYSSHKHF